MKALLFLPLALVGYGVFYMYEKNGSKNPSKAVATKAATNASIAAGGASASGSGSVTLPPVTIQGNATQPSPAPALPTAQEPSQLDDVLGSLQNAADDILAAAGATNSFPVQAIVATNTDPLNVRNAPNKNAPIVGKLAKGSGVNITGPAVPGDGSQTGGWAPVQQGPIVGFASMAFLDTGTP
jgi:hypothetical protein